MDNLINAPEWQLWAAALICAGMALLCAGRIACHAVIRARRWLRARRERRAGTQGPTPIKTYVNPYLTDKDHIYVFQLQEPNAERVAICGPEAAAPYTPDGSAPPKPWARDVGELALRVKALESGMVHRGAFASKPTAPYRVWATGGQLYLTGRDCAGVCES
jgi:hypothetical protein